MAVGLYRDTAGGGPGVAETVVRLFDVVVRAGTNTLSFARLAAFGLTHAALAGLVWRGTTALAGRGGAGVVGAVLLFVVGTAVTFGLKPWWPGCRPCGWSSTSSSPGSSGRRAVRSVPGGFPARNPPTPL
ncbi:hypothetical protein [Streptomyces murinus]|uniref:hypothetical protein n=1 Tax=Streptomyces murinus TaxID=33900 RepID=UPI003D667E9D